MRKEPFIVVLWRNGDVCVVTLEDFIARELEKDGDSVCTNPSSRISTSASVGWMWGRDLSMLSDVRYEKVITGALK
jgi:hypothetical protein